MNDERPSLTEVWELAGGTVVGHGDGWQKASCFLHADRTPSASVNEDLGKFACFSCGERGDVYDVIQMWQHLETFKEVQDFVRSAGLKQQPTQEPPSSSGGLRRATHSSRQRVPGKAGATRRGGFRPAWRGM